MQRFITLFCLVVMACVNVLAGVPFINHYGIEEVNFHRAIDDTKALYDVTLAMKDERNDLGEYINVFGYNPKYGVSGKEFSFIEYKKQRFNNRMVSQERILPKI
mgnify:CR=1 FL=1